MSQEEQISSPDGLIRDLLKVNSSATYNIYCLKLEDTAGVIRSRTSKDRQYNGLKKRKK